MTSYEPEAVESSKHENLPAGAVVFRQYVDEASDLPTVMGLVDKELSEPYSVFTYRYFLHNWPELCHLAFDGEHCFGVVVCKLEKHHTMLRGYIAMLVVEHAYRGNRVGTELVRRVIQRMVEAEADEVVLEAEVGNTGALRLYENLGFIRDKRLCRYYLNGQDAFRLKLLLPLSPARAAQVAAEQLANMAIGYEIPASDAADQEEHAQRIKCLESLGPSPLP